MPNNDTSGNDGNHSDSESEHSTNVPNGQNGNNSNSNNSNSSSSSSNQTTSSTSSNTITVDISNIVIYDTNPSHNTVVSDCSNVDLSGATLAVPTIVNYTLNQVDQEVGYTVTNKQGTDASGNMSTVTTFVTTDPSSDIQIDEILVGSVTKYYDDEGTGPSAALLNEIKDYAAQIQCSDFHGKGTIEDYTELFTAASRIANETKQMQLNVDVTGFSEFGQAADDLSSLFNGFILKLQNVSIINDVVFLQGIADALKKIYNLSNIFGRFKETILATSTIQIPKSAHDATVIIHGVMDEVNCAMKYINHFVDPTLDVSGTPYDADLSIVEQNIISKAVSTIDSWNVLCEQGVSLAMSSDPDIQFVTAANQQLKNKTNILMSATSKLRAKLAMFDMHC